MFTFHSTEFHTDHRFSLVVFALAPVLTVLISDKGLTDMASESDDKNSGEAFDWLAKLVLGTQWKCLANLVDFKYQELNLDSNIMFFEHAAIACQSLPDVRLI